MTDAEPADDLVESVIAHALELRDQGYADWLELATENCPECVDQVREAVEHTDMMAEMFGDPAGTPVAGTTFGGRFRIGRRIGVGAMGAVHIAEDLKLIRQVAVKILHGGVTDKQQALRRFLREAEAMASVQHPSIVTIHDQGLTPDGDPFIVMELVDGVPLSTLVESAAEHAALGATLDSAWLAAEHGIEVAQAASWVQLVATWTAELAAGLEVVHAAGVLHRDIKPSNIIIRKHGQPVLLDFGLALLDADSTLTRGQTSVGTPVYMPPEGLVRRRDRGPTSDVYSLAATLYHLVTLMAPYRGTPTEVLAALATRDPEPPQHVRPGLPRDLQAIVEMGMHRRPQKRYPTAAALEADLLAFLDLRAVVARPVSPLRRLARRAVRSNMVRGAALALAVIALLWLGLALRARHDRGIRERDFAIRQALPPALTLVGVRNRVFRYDADREQVRALLDEGVDLGVSPVTLPLLRAAFRLDHGDPAGAADDMARVAKVVDTPFAHALAERYASLPSTADVTTRIDLADLPAPTSARDHFLEGFHALRAGQEARASAAFALPEVQALDETAAAANAIVLHCALAPYRRLEIGARFSRALDAYNALLALELRQGGPTAATRNQIGHALGILQRYREGLDATRQALTLAPRAYTVRINAGYLAMRLGLHAEAREHLQVALDMRPNYAKPLDNYIWVLIAEGAFDEALAVLHDAPLDDTPSNARLKLELELAVEVQRALALRSAGDEPAASAALERAAAQLERIGPDAHSAQAVIHSALLANDQEALFAGLIELYLKDPGSSWLLDALIQQLPHDLSSGATALTGQLLESLAAPQLRLVND